MAKIFGSVKSGVRAAFDPMGRALVRAGISPDVVTIAGTVGVVAAAVAFIGRGLWIAATIAITLSALLDVLDGAMARARGRSSRFGAVLDSTMDRVADGALFGTLAWYLGTNGQQLLAAVAIVCLVGGQVVSYVKARAEASGFSCDVGIAERLERLLIIAAGGLLQGFGVDWGLAAALWTLAVASIVTAGQRLGHVYRQARVSPAGSAGDPPPNGRRGRRPAAVSARRARRPDGMSGRLVEASYAAGWRIVRALPASAGWAAFRLAADGMARRRGPAVRRFEQNLRRVVGPEVPAKELGHLVRDGLRSYARYWLQAFRLPTRSPEQHLRGFRLERGHLLGEAVRSGTGCVIALPHAGNWDAAGAWVCANGWPLTTVAERLKPERLYRRFVAFRESLGMEIIPTEGGERPPIEILEARVRAGHVVPLLADRDLSTRGVEVTFFGGRTRMPAGPAMLALRTGAPLYTVTLWYEGDLPCGHLVGPLTVPGPELGPIDVRVRALTQTVADQLAEGIAKHPADWHMLQRLWLDEQRPG